MDWKNLIAYYKFYYSLNGQNLQWFSMCHITFVVYEYKYYEYKYTLKIIIAL